VLLSPWCLGEITTANLNSVDVKPLYFSDFEAPTDDFLDAIDNLVKLERLTESGIGVSDIRTALVWFRDLSHLDVQERVTDQSLNALLGEIHSANSSISGFLPSILSSDSASALASTNGQKPHNFGSKDRPNVLFFDGSNREASAGALIFIKLITPVLSHAPKEIPVLQEYDQDATRHGFGMLCTDTVLIIFCTQGCFASPAFLLGLLHCVSIGVNYVVPIVAADDFQFPTKAFYKTLEQNVQNLCLSSLAPDVDGSLLTSFVESIFQKICSRLSLLSNIEVLKVQAQLIWKVVEDRDGARVNGFSMNERQSSLVAHFTTFGLDPPQKKLLLPRLRAALHLHPSKDTAASFNSEEAPSETCDSEGGPATRVHSI